MVLRGACAPRCLSLTSKIKLRAWLLVILLLGLCVAAGSSADIEDAKKSEGSDATAEINLYELTDAELEAICTSRGFELVREIDDATGEEVSYSHDDFVDAAKECLELEEEMETFFQENPNLLGDLQAETEAMMKEKEELEQQLAEAQDTLKKEKKAVSPENVDKGGKNEYRSSLPYGDETSVENESSRDDGEKKAETSNEGHGKEDEHGSIPAGNKDEDGSPSAEVGSASISEDQHESDVEKANSESGGVNETDAAAKSELRTSSDSKDEGPLSFPRLMKETVMEFRDKVQKDLARVGEIILPEPLREPLKGVMGVAFRVAKSAVISIASMLKRYFIALLDSVKEVRSADATPEGEEKPSVLKRYFTAVLNAVKKARADGASEESSDAKEAVTQ